MPAARRTVVVELGSRQIAVSLERPALFRTLDDFRLACFSHAINIFNTRGLNADDLALLARLGDPHEFVQQALTANRALCWQGEDVGVPTSLRKPVTDQGWYAILREGGLAPIRRITTAFLSLFPGSREA